jgi:hypothetical protein
MNTPDFLPVLSRSSHLNPDEGACVMEMVSFLAGEKWSDSPNCVLPVLQTIAITVNDWVSDDNRNRIALLIPDFMDTRKLDTETLKSRVQAEVLPDYYNYFSAGKFQYLATCSAYSFNLTEITHVIREAANADVITMSNEEWDNEMIGYLEKVMAIVRDMKPKPTVVDMSKAATHVSQKVNA